MGAPRLNKNKYIHHLLQSYNMMRIYNLPRRAVRSEGTSTIVGNQIGSSPNQLSQLNVNVEDLLLKIDKLEAENAKLTREQGLKHMLNLGQPELNPVAIYLKDEMTGEKEIVRAQLEDTRAQLEDRELDFENLKERILAADAGHYPWNRCGRCEVIMLNDDHVECDYGHEESICHEQCFCPDCWRNRRARMFEWFTPGLNHRLLGPYTGNMCVYCAEERSQPDSEGDEDEEVSLEALFEPSWMRHWGVPAFLYVDSYGVGHMAFPSSDADTDTDTDEDNRMTGQVVLPSVGGE